MRSNWDGRRCGYILACRPEEGFGIPLRNPTFHLLLDRLPLATWLDPPDECAAAVLPKPACPLLDRSHICGTIPRTGTRRLFLLPARPNSLCARASALPPGNSRSAATLLPPACGPRYQRRIH